MNWFNNVSVTIKLGVFGGVLLLALAIVAYDGHGVATEWRGDVREVRDVVVPELVSVNALNTERMEIRAQTLDVMLQTEGYRDKTGLTRIAQQREGSWAQVDDHWQRLEALVPEMSAGQQRMFEALRGQYQAWRSIYTELDALIQRLTEIRNPEQYQRAMEDYQAVVERMVPISEEMGGSFIEMLEYVVTSANDLAAEAYAAAASAQREILVISGVAGAVAVVLFLLLLRALLPPLRALQAHFAAMGQGDLNQTIEANRKDEVGRALRGLADMQAKLRGLIGQVRASVDAINTGAGEIAKGNADLSQRTEEQASSLEETASSMEELTSTVKQNADNARQADQLATATRDVAAQGGEKAGAAMKSMNEITASAEKIAEIITVIDGIAFQTNILALNAAVEAARAGEQGRGFAVVAGEVRNLAQRSATAAKEIKALLAEDAQTVEKGSKLVLEAGQTMEDIVNHVKRVSDLIGEISAASDEQSSGIEQVNTAVTQMDEVTQQNAALVEEAAAAAESLEEQAQELMQAVSMFRVEEASAFRAADNSGAGRPKQASGDTPPRQPEAPSLVHSGPGKPRAAKKAAPLPAPKAGARRGTDDEWEEF